MKSPWWWFQCGFNLTCPTLNGLNKELFMIKTAEAVSLGHPDKTADFISSYILDKMIEMDPYVKYAVEVMVKDNNIIMGGEIAGKINMSNINKDVHDAICFIGYDEKYSSRWGEFAINPDKIKITNLIGAQSCDISRGVENNGWGDQGVFVGYACVGEQNINRELYLAKKLNFALYNHAKSSDTLGLDIKTQITLDNNNHIETAIVAIPMLKDENIEGFICDVLGEKPKNIIVNGTGRYTYHSSIADCGITGRKLACDFYSTACPIGGGSPWTKDATKADLTLNLYARKIAVARLCDNDECFVYLSSCIGKNKLPSAVIKTIKDGITKYESLIIEKTPSEIISELGLRTPLFSDLCIKSVSGAIY